jgi:ribosomal protein L11
MSTTWTDILDGAATTYGATQGPTGPAGPTGPQGPPGDVTVTDTSLVTATGATTARTLANRFGDAINVKDFGAVGDGVADDTADIQAALAVGVPVEFPAGTYIVSTLTPPTGAVLFGHGGATIKRKTGTTSHLINISSKQNVTISDLTIDGNRAAVVGSVAGIILQTSAGITLRNLRVINSPWNGVDIRTGTNDTYDTYHDISDCLFDTNANNGLNIYQEDRVKVRGCTFSKNGANGCLCSGIVDADTRDISITDCVAVENTQNGISSLRDTANPPLYYPVHGLVLSGCLCERNNKSGICIQAKRVSATGNVCRGNGVGTTLPGYLINSEYTTFTGNVSCDNTSHGVDFGDCSHFVASGNMFYNNDGHGCEINAVDNFAFVGNVLLANNQTSHAGVNASGIWLQIGAEFLGTSSQTVITNNIITLGPFQRYGIYVLGSPDRVLVGQNSLRSSGTVSDVLFNGSVYGMSGPTAQDNSLIVASYGSNNVKIQTSGVDGVTAGEFVSKVSATAWPQLSGGTASANIGVGGVAGSILNIRSLGGVVYIGDSTTNALLVVPADLADAQVTVDPGTPSVEPRIRITGSGNRDLRLEALGTGTVRFGTHTANADAAITGYVTIKTSDDTTRKLAVIA